MEIDAERLMNIKAKITTWMGKKYATLKQVQSIVGSLSFCASCIPEGRLFFSRILSFMKTLKGNGFHQIPREVRKDPNWWHIFVQDFNGIAVIPSLDWNNQIQFLALMHA